MTPNPIPLFDRDHSHPSVPTWRPPKRGAQTRSRMPPAAPAEPARSVLDGAEHRAILMRQGRAHCSDAAGLPPAKKPLPIGGESSPVAKSAQLHTMMMQGGEMRMRRIAGVNLPAGKAVTLRPGGMHIMLIGLTEPLKEGESFPLTLSFKSGGTKEITVSVAKVGAMAPAGSMGGMSMPMPR